MPGDNRVRQVYPGGRIIGRSRLYDPPSESGPCLWAVRAHPLAEVRLTSVPCNSAVVACYDVMGEIRPEYEVLRMPGDPRVIRSPQTRTRITGPNAGGWRTMGFWGYCNYDTCVDGERFAILVMKQPGYGRVHGWTNG